MLLMSHSVMVNGAASERVCVIDCYRCCCPSAVYRNGHTTSPSALLPPSECQ